MPATDRRVFGETDGAVDVLKLAKFVNDKRRRRRYSSPFILLQYPNSVAAATSLSGEMVSTRHRRTLILSSLFFAAAHAQSYPEFDTQACRVLLSSSQTYDLGSIKGEHSAKKTREIPPSTEVDEVRFNLCEDLAKQHDVAESDQVSGVFL